NLGTASWWPDRSESVERKATADLQRRACDRRSRYDRARGRDFHIRDSVPRGRRANPLSRRGLSPYCGRGRHDTVWAVFQLDADGNDRLNLVFALPLALAYLRIRQISNRAFACSV